MSSTSVISALNLVASSIQSGAALPSTFAGPAGVPKDLPDVFSLPDLPRRKAWTDPLVALLAVMGGTLVVGAPIVMWMTDLNISAEPVAIAVQAAVIVGVVFKLVSRRGHTLPSIGLDRSSFKVNALVGIVSYSVTLALFLWIVMAATVLWPQFESLLEQNECLLSDSLPDMHPLGFVPLAFLIALAEEILFRGFIMTRLCRAAGSWAPAVILSTLLFAAFHLGDQKAAAVALIAVFSLGLSVLTIWRGSIVPAITAHFLFDLTFFMQSWIEQNV